MKGESYSLDTRLLCYDDHLSLFRVLTNNQRSIPHCTGIHGTVYHAGKDRHGWLSLSLTQS